MTERHFLTLTEALEEVKKCRKTQDMADSITTYRESPYGGFIVSTIPADLIVDELAEPVTPHGTVSPFVQKPRTLYR